MGFGHLLCLLIATTAVLLAQITTAEIGGVVPDAQGLIIPNTRVEVENTDTGQSFTTATSQTGAYLFRSLPPGPYSLSAENAGFKRFVRSGINLVAGQVLQLDVRLEVGRVAETVTVSEQVSPINITTSTLDTRIDHKKLVDLPLNSRNILSLVGLSAGVTRASISNGPSFGQQNFQRQWGIRTPPTSCSTVL